MKRYELLTLCKEMNSKPLASYARDRVRDLSDCCRWLYMSVWRNRQTRMFEVHMSQGVEVQVLSWTPLFSRSKEKRDATPFGAKYASLAQLDRATAF